MPMPIYDENDAASDTMLESMTDEWVIWCALQGIICVDAEEALLDDTLTKYQRIYISSFIVRWDAVMSTST